MQGETLTVAEAAQQLGVNDKTVRRWVKAGRLSAELIDGPYGKQYRIPADAIGSARQTLAVVTVERGADPHALALAVARALEPRDALLCGEVEQLRQQLAVLRDLLEERLPMPVQGVQTPGRAPQQPVEAPGAPESPDPTMELTALWWRWIVLLAPVLVTAIVVLVVLLVVPR